MNDDDFIGYEEEEEDPYEKWNIKPTHLRPMKDKEPVESGRRTPQTTPNKTKTVVERTFTSLSAASELDFENVLDGEYEPKRPSVLSRDDGKALFYRGEVSSLYGEAESAKSFIAQMAAAEVLNQPSGKVIYIDYESDFRTVVRRLVSLGVDMEPGDFARRFVYLHPTESMMNPSDNARKDIEDTFNVWAELVVIDGVTEAFAIEGVTSTDNDGVSEWMRRVPKWVAGMTGAAVVLIDHVVKSKDDRGRFAIGAQAKMSALTGVAYKVKPVRLPVRGGRGSVRLSVTKDRPGSVREFADKNNSASDGSMAYALVNFDSTENPNVIKWEVVAWDSKSTQTGDIADDLADEITDGIPEAAVRKVSEALSKFPNGTTKTALARNVTGTRNATKFDALTLLVEEGYAREENGKFFPIKYWTGTNIPENSA